MTSEYSEGQGGEGAGAGGYLALVLGWVVPGLGHWILGERARAAVFAVAIHGLFAAGMLISGVRAINPPEQQIWTYTQFLTGWPMLVASPLQRQKAEDLKRWEAEYGLRPWMGKDGVLHQRPSIEDDSKRDERMKSGKAYLDLHPLFSHHPKVQDIGAVYCGIAGMLNLLVMFDVLLRITGSQRETGGDKKAAAPAAAREGAR